jgi:hypothetical protein
MRDIPLCVCTVRQAHHRREGDQERVFAAITVYSSGAVSDDSTVKVLCEGFSDLIP